LLNEKYGTEDFSTADASIQYRNEVGARLNVTKIYLRTKRTNISDVSLAYQTNLHLVNSRCCSYRPYSSTSSFPSTIKSPQVAVHIKLRTKGAQNVSGQEHFLCPQRERGKRLNTTLFGEKDSNTIKRFRYHLARQNGTQPNHEKNSNINTVTINYKVPLGGPDLFMSKSGGHPGGTAEAICPG